MTAVMNSKTSQWFFFHFNIIVFAGSPGLEFTPIASVTTIQWSHRHSCSRTLFKDTLNITGIPFSGCSWGCFHCSLWNRCREQGGHHSKSSENPCQGQCQWKGKGFFSQRLYQRRSQSQSHAEGLHKSAHNLKPSLKRVDQQPGNRRPARSISSSRCCEETSSGI